MHRMTRHLSGMKKQWLWFLLLLFCLPGFAQQIAPLGKWTSYVSHTQVVEIAHRKGVMHVITQGGLFTHDISSGEINSYTTTEGLSEVRPSTVFYDEQNDQIFIGFASGMINYYNEAGSFNYITDIERNTEKTNKGINKIISNNEFVYIATDFGIVVYDFDKKETSNTIEKIGSALGETEVVSIAIVQDTLWATLGADGIYKAPLAHPNIRDPSAWSSEEGLHNLPADKDYRSITTTGDILYVIASDSIYRKVGGTWYPAPLTPGYHTYLRGFGDTLVHVRSSITTIISPDSSITALNNNGSTKSAYAAHGYLWLGDDLAGFLRYKDGDYQLAGPKGPNNNSAAWIIAGKGEFYMAPNGITPPSISTGDFQSGIPYFNLDNGWFVWDHRTRRLDSTTIFKDFVRGYYDPTSEHAYIGSWASDPYSGGGLFEFYHGDTIRSYTPYNSGISYNGSKDDCRVSGIAKDAAGNLWVSVLFADNNLSLNVLTTDGEWYAYQTKDFFPFFLVIDEYGTKWMGSKNSGTYGLVAFNENGTFDDISDDDIRFITKSQGEGNLPTTVIRALSKDLDGNIWVGTEQGAVVFYDPGSVFTSNFQDASCPIFDGFCLLRNEFVNAIAVDGANRKWIGTENGLFFISEDGTEQILKFTTQNSPLISDRIFALDIDQSTGEVLIGTENGMMGYMGDAIAGVNEVDDIDIFPNPVYTDYNGQVTIRGSVKDSKMKIVTVSGKLVKELDTLGGQGIWDGTDVRGNKVQSGVYLVMIADKDGNNKGTGKIAVVNR